MAQRIKVGSVQLNNLGHTSYAAMLRNGFAQSEKVDLISKWVNEDASLWEKFVFRVLTSLIPGGSRLRIRHLEFIRYRHELAYAYHGRQRTKRLIIESHPNVIHFNTQTAAALSCDLLRGIPMAVTLDTTAVQAAEELRNPRHKWTFGPVVEMDRRVFAAASALFPMSELTAASLVRDYGVPKDIIHVIYPSIDFDKIKNQPRPLRSEKKLCSLLFVGNDFDRKGGPDLLDVFQNRLPDNCELHLATGADLNIDHPRISVHRNLKAFSAKWYELYETADICVLPTHSDCSPQVIMEAMANGLPIVSTYVGAIPEMAPSGVNSILYRHGDRDALAESIKTLLSDRELSRNMGLRNRQRAEEIFNSKKTAARMEAVFENLATKSRLV